MLDSVAQNKVVRKFVLTLLLPLCGLKISTLARQKVINQKERDISKIEISKYRYQQIPLEINIMTCEIKNRCQLWKYMFLLWSVKANKLIWSNAVREGFQAEMFLVLCFQGVTGLHGGRGERGHQGNPVKQTLSLHFPVFLFIIFLFTA